MPEQLPPLDKQVRTTLMGFTDALSAIQQRYEVWEQAVSGGDLSSDAAAAITVAVRAIKTQARALLDAVRADAAALRQLLQVTRDWYVQRGLPVDFTGVMNQALPRLGAIGRAIGQMNALGTPLDDLDERYGDPD